MFRYTRHYARIYNSPALMADAWHHRSDALSSIGAWIGIAGARHGFPVLDAVSSLVICALIAKAAYDIFMDAVSRIVDHSCDASTEYQLYRCAKSVSGVRGIDRIQSRIFASRIYVDMEISVDGSLRLYDAHEIAEDVHKTVETTFPEVKHIMIHINPASPPN